MAIHVPQKEAFETATKHYNQLQWFEIISSLVTILFTILAVCSFYMYIEGFVNVISLILLIVAMYFKIRFQMSYREAERIRRDSLIDNSFGTKLSETEAVEYYGNTGMGTGIHKLLAAIHESSILSLAVINRMVWKQALVNLIIGIILIIACAISSLQSTIFLALFNGFMSINMIGSFIELFFLKAEIRKVSDNCKNICENHLKISNGPLSTIAQAHIIRECMRYENALSYGSIMFDETTYKKINPMHNKKWETIKKRYYSEYL